jgi:hypothetical protein
MSRAHNDHNVQARRYQFIYSMTGLFLGFLSMIGGVALCLNGFARSTGWAAAIPGNKGAITDGLPGALLFAAGLLVIFSTRHKVRLTVDNVRRGPDKPDEQQVELAVQGILTELDRKCRRFATINEKGDEAIGDALAVIVVVGAILTGFATFFLVKARLSFPWWGSLGVSVVSLPVSLFFFFLAREAVLASIVRGGRRQFEERFPYGSAEWPIALRILSEMQTSSGAERKLGKAIGDRPRIVRRTHAVKSPEPRTTADEVRARRSATAWRSQFRKSYRSGGEIANHRDDSANRATGREHASREDD